MKLKEAINELGIKESYVIAKKHAIEMGEEWDSSINSIFSALNQNPWLIPGNISGGDEKEAVTKWVNRYLNAKDNRKSIHTALPPKTVPDPAIDLPLTIKLESLDKKEINKIIDAHRLSMNLENLIGSLLEEYIFENLKTMGWSLAWGSSLKSTDFVVEKNSKLYFWQIKNRSNSENSSSKRVRSEAKKAGVIIELWYRTDAYTGETKWDELNDQIKVRYKDVVTLNENSFQDYIKKVSRNNPDIIAIEKDSYYQKFT